MIISIVFTFSKGLSIAKQQIFWSVEENNHHNIFPNKRNKINHITHFRQQNFCLTPSSR
jgi:hypothetical protein